MCTLVHGVIWDGYMVGFARQVRWGGDDGFMVIVWWYIMISYEVNDGMMIFDNML